MGHAVGEASEIRTQGPNSAKKTNLELTEEQKQQLESLDGELDREWFALKRKRHEVGRILAQINAILAEEGAFSQFLQSKRIARSTAYDLISDYKRWAKLPLPILEAAERQQVDLSERKYACLLERQLDDADILQISDEQADNLVRIVDQKAKRSYAEPVELPSLEHHRRALMKAFESVHALVGNETPSKRGTRLAELLSYVVYSYQLDPNQLAVKPEPPPSWLFTGIGEDAAK